MAGGIEGGEVRGLRASHSSKQKQGPEHVLEALKVV
jgi:hypothetical protein